jgi:DNA ligase (NAD+)
LLEAGITIKSPLPKEGKLKGLNFIFTGALASMTRQEAARLVEQNGGKVVDSISKRVNFVVVGESPGSKLEKAKKLGLKLLTEQEFLELIKGG